MIKKKRLIFAMNSTAMCFGAVPWETRPLALRRYGLIKAQGADSSR